MKSAFVVAATLVAFASGVRAAETYDNYAAFYDAQPGTVFRNPIKYDRNAIYSYQGEKGTYAEMQTALDGKTINVMLAENRLTINGRTYRFASAMTFAGEHPSYIDPFGADVFLASRTTDHPAILCLEATTEGSGEADRHTQIYLLINPLAQKGKVKFLHLPSLLSSCRAVVATKDGKLAFPKNSYLFDDAQESRVGLLVSYYSFENQRFVSVPFPNQLRLRFTNPEIPFQFSVEDKD
ncbi:hypothetical protein [Paraburkholderia sp.]|uniref:hypothetical protein n=1 Tax=Paraburkholderia sp. TaxID=1926495 RepID=UPI0025E225C8|nr:hypothetical protein [Paraburkholderia sp.]